MANIETISIEQPCMKPQLEAARRLLAELKAAYDALPASHRRAVREAISGRSTL